MKIFVFSIKRFRMMDGEIKITDTKYQIPAKSFSEAIFRLGATFNKYEVVYTVKDGLNVVEISDGEDQAIMFEASEN